MEKRDFNKRSAPRINSKANAGKTANKPRQRFFNKNGDKKTMHDRPFKDTTVKRLGFSPFQIRLIQSILSSVLVDGKPLDKAYAYWFAKVKIQALEQGFLIKQINAMFRRLSFYAIVCCLKRPSDLSRHINWLILAYCAEQEWPLPDIDAEGFDRAGLKERIKIAKEDELLNEGCPIWLNELCSKELGDKWPQERKALAKEPSRYIRANALKTTRENLGHVLSEEGVVTRPVKGVYSALEVTSNAALFRTSAFKEGLFEQQDAGSQLIPPFLDAKPGMRVIDVENRAVGTTERLQPPRNPDRKRERLVNRRRGKTEVEHRQQRPGKIVDVVHSDQSDRHVKRPLRTAEPEPGSRGVQFHISDPPHRSRNGAESDHPHTGKLSGQTRPPGIVHVDDRGRTAVQIFGEKALFRLVIMLHVPVVVEVIAAQIGKNAGAETRTGDPVLRQCVAGKFHRDRLLPVPPHFRQQREQHTRLRGGLRGRSDQFPVPVLHRRNQAAGNASVTEQVLHQKRGGRFPVGSGDAEETQHLIRPFIELPAAARIRLAGTGDHQIGDAAPVVVERLLVNDDLGCRLQRRFDEIAAVKFRPRNRHKNISWQNLAGIVLDPSGRPVPQKSPMSDQQISQYRFK